MEYRVSDGRGRPFVWNWRACNDSYKWNKWMGLEVQEGTERII